MTLVFHERKRISLEPWNAWEWNYVRNETQCYQNEIGCHSKTNFHELSCMICCYGFPVFDYVIDFAT